MNERTLQDFFKGFGITPMHHEVGDMQPPSSNIQHASPNTLQAQAYMQQTSPNMQQAQPYIPMYTPQGVQQAMQQTPQANMIPALPSAQPAQIIMSAPMADFLGPYGYDVALAPNQDKIAGAVAAAMVDVRKYEQKKGLDFVNEENRLKALENHRKRKALEHLHIVRKAGKILYYIGCDDYHGPMYRLFPHITGLSVLLYRSKNNSEKVLELTILNGEASIKRLIFLDEKAGAKVDGIFKREAIEVNISPRYRKEAFDKLLPELLYGVNEIVLPDDDGWNDMGDALEFITESVLTFRRIKDEAK